MVILIKKMKYVSVKFQIFQNHIGIKNICYFSMYWGSIELKEGPHTSLECFSDDIMCSASMLQKQFFGRQKWLSYSHVIAMFHHIFNIFSQAFRFRKQTRNQNHFQNTSPSKNYLDKCLDGLRLSKQFLFVSLQFWFYNLLTLISFFSSLHVIN